MEDKMKRHIKRRIIFGILILIFFCVCPGGMNRLVYADEENQVFEIEIQMLPSANYTYDIRVTVENTGQDWEGVARLRLINDSYGYGECAYDTELSLPQGSIKQFVVKMPKESITNSMHWKPGIKITLLDNDSHVVKVKEFWDFFDMQADAFQMGILSDSVLTYLDLGGEEVYYNGKYLPIKLTQLNQDNLSELLDTLTILVIDHFNTSVLSDEVIEQIERWIDTGGVLLVGTGTYAEDTLSGLENLKIECTKVNEANETNIDTDVDIILSELALAELQDVTHRYYVEHDTQVWTYSWGNGAVGVLPYSLSELDSLNWAESKKQTSISYVLDQIMTTSNSRYTSYEDKNLSILHRAFRTFGNSSSRLDFDILKWIIILYVIFVGPVLYLILRFVKKRDFYWMAVPMTVLVTILLVYWAGRGFEIEDTSVYSVTVENLSGAGDSKTYMRCYNADRKEWELCLTQGYEYAGPVEGVSYRYYDPQAEPYYYHIRKEGDRVFFGLKPSASFEDCYFVASGTKKAAQGTIVVQDIIERQDGGKGFGGGTIINETDWDFPYFAVIAYNELYVYTNLNKGETCDLATAQLAYGWNGYYGIASYWDDFMSDAYEKKKDTDLVSALGIGICSVYTKEDPTAVVVIGVTKDWEKVVESRCNEESYGCLFVIQ